MTLTLDIAFKIGSLVYLKTDVQQLPRFVVGYAVRLNNEVMYELQHGDNTVSNHYAFEISEEINVLMNSTN